MQQSKHLMETHTQHEGELKLRDRWNCSSWKLRSTAKFQERIRSVWIYWKNICVTPKEMQYLRWSDSINQNWNWTEIWRRSKETGIFKRAFSSIYQLRCLWRYTWRDSQAHFARSFTEAGDEYEEIERIVGKKARGRHTYYFVKWKSR